MTRRSAVHSEVLSWLRQSVTDFEKQRKEQADAPTRGLPSSLLEKLADFDQGEHERNQLPVGMFFDAIDITRLGERRATTYQLMTVAQVGYELFARAILHPDVTDEFLEEAGGQFDPMMTHLLHNSGLEYYRRDPITGEEAWYGPK